ncbi:amino acid ABC transporter permease [Tropicibacter naphthalenivorans]|uniref:Inner membrane amino-acid ABC transporter permease protein YhdY n=1 Tax=Tropicibacter naphthalenivorans TaxID=441103 RepID=A0A0P1H2F3_9RHOB|nr:amino acid ABC transporter permease [Tropicibacter naphthalenivorans]CUH82661.1 Inner membrane amino-acid ABC transporter permease protein YhdY [Tropicibacter naphthalenivorans]SMD10220.1 amino acid ABC transporter membrane protein 2, PAAT family [Tropicibacter naphthalenivorans]
MQEHETDHWVRTHEAPRMDPPSSSVGPRAWLWKNIFASMADYSTPGKAVTSVMMLFMTVFSAYALVWMVWTMLDFALFSATFFDPEGLKRDACLVNPAGACWPFVQAKWYQFMFGFYPPEEVWRVKVAMAILGVGIAWLVFPLPHRGKVAAFMLIGFPILSYVLLNGMPVEDDGDLGHIFAGAWFPLVLAAAAFAAWFIANKGQFGDVGQAFAPALLMAAVVLGAWGMLPLVTMVIDLALGTEVVETNKWGGLTITLVVAIFGIVISLPVGMVLALGRRSNAPIIRYSSVIFIEVVRGIPLISVLFFASAMLPYFLEPGVDFNKLLRAMIGVVLFASAYMAEVIRGGLQAIPKGQYEGGMSLGLSYWQQMRLIIMPQALTTVIPGIVNTFIGLFKDTTLVLIISIFDLLGILSATLKDPEWSTPTTAYTGYLVIAMIYWVFCFGMSRYSVYMERKLDRGHR